jgi:hypothetical protein
MSDRVTWEGCPICGEPAAVGWVTLVGRDAGAASEDPMEFDCPSRCDLTVDEMRRAFGKPVQP